MMNSPLFTKPLVPEHITYNLEVFSLRPMIQYWIYASIQKFSEIKQCRDEHQKGEIACSSIGRNYSIKWKSNVTLTLMNSKCTHTSSSWVTLTNQLVHNGFLVTRLIPCLSTQSTHPCTTWIRILGVMT